MLKHFKRLLLALQLYALEISIDGQTDCLAMVADPILKKRIEIARSNARRERTRLRCEFNALLPVGQRRTWKLA